MYRGTTRRRKKSRSNETEGLGFAVTLLASMAAVIYTANEYLQNTSIDSLFFYESVIMLISIALVLVAGLIIYILIKGYLIEVRDINQKENLEKVASAIYLMIFLIFIILLVFVLAISILQYIKIEGGFIYLFFIFATISLTVGFIFIRPISGKKFLKSILYLLSLFCVGLFLIMLLTFTIQSTDIIGHVTVEMESIYYHNNTPIPVLIQVTGCNIGVRIYLYERRYDHSLIITDRIYISQKSTREISTSNQNYLRGNAFGHGKYNIFINTSNLTTGYYELVCWRLGFPKDYDGKGFYLLNSSHISK